MLNLFYIAQRIKLACLNTFKAAGTFIGLINTGVAVIEYFNFTKHVLRTSFNTLPAGLAIMAVKTDELCCVAAAAE